jgi:hypothetical protein
MSPNVKINSVQGIIGTILISSPFAILGVGKERVGTEYNEKYQL